MWTQDALGSLSFVTVQTGASPVETKRKRVLKVMSRWDGDREGPFLDGAVKGAKFISFVSLCGLCHFII